MRNHLLQLNILFFSLLICLQVNAQLSGNYTIGGVSPDFTTIQNAVNALSAQGVAADVHFSIRPGSYNEKITIGTIPGVSASAHVTFESETADSSDVWWTSISTNDATNYIVKCEASNYLIFKNLTFRNSGFGSIAILLNLGSSYCTIENCHFSNLVMPTQNFYRYNVINTDANPNLSITIHNNQFKNGHYALFSSGSTISVKDSNFVVSNNTINGSAGIYLDKIENLTISNNTIQSGNIGLQISNFGNPTTINGNYSKGYNTGIMISSNNNNPSLLSGLFIYNNFFIGHQDAAKIIGGNGYTEITNNSFLNTNMNYLDTYSACLINTSCNLRNNIFSNYGSGYALKLMSASNTVLSDYNLFNNSGTKLIYYAGVLFNDLPEWQSYILAHDQHSYEHAPWYVGIEDLHVLTNSNLYDKGTPVAYITEDIDGEPRIGNPDIGADEFNLASNDGSISIDYYGIDSINCAGQTNLFVRVKNEGGNSIDSALIHYSINNSIQTPLTYAGTLLYDSLSPYISLPVVLPIDLISVIKVWYTNIDGSNDQNNLNDTLFIGPFLSRMNGIYTVGTSNSDYPTIPAAIAAISTRGICGNVTLKIKSGTYSAFADIPNFYRENSTDTLTITSEAENPDSVIWYDANTYQAIYIENYTNIYIKNITFKRSNSSTGALQLIAAYTQYVPLSYNFSVQNCKFNNGYNSISQGEAIFLYGNGFRIKNCTIDSCSAGIKNVNIYPYLVYQNDQCIVENCTFKSIVEYGISMMDQKNVHIESNTFDNPVMTNQLYPTAVDLFHMDSSIFIERNKFQGVFYSAIYVSGYDTSQHSTVKIRNNFFAYIQKNINQGMDVVTAEGMNYLEIISNSFNVKHTPYYFNSTTSVTSAHLSCFIDAQFTDLHLKNNSFKADTIISVISTYTLLPPEIDHNNIFIDSLETSIIAFSFQIPPFTTYYEPSYVSFEDLHLTGNELEDIGITTDLEIDIDNNIRYSPPTIGAAEAIQYLYDLDVTENFVSQSCDSVSFYATVTNQGNNAIDSMYIHYTINNTYTDSFIVHINLLENQFVDSILLLTLPIIYDSIYTVETITNLLGHVDENNFNDALTSTFLFNSIPQNILGNDTILCNGHILTLELPSNPSYTSIQWNNEPWGLNYTYQALNGTNVVQIENNIGCLYSDTIQILIEDFPVFAFNYSNGDLTCNGWTVDWYKDGFLVATQQDTIHPTSNGIYMVSYTNENNCTYYSDGFYVLYTPNGINELGSNYLEIYPIPFTDMIYFNSDFALNSVFIYDLNSKFIGEYTITNNQLNLSTLNNGMYLLKIVTEDGREIIRKIIK